MSVLKSRLIKNYEDFFEEGPPKSYIEVERILALASLMGQASIVVAVDERYEEVIEDFTNKELYVEELEFKDPTLIQNAKAFYFEWVEEEEGS